MKIEAGLVLANRYRLLSRIAIGGMGEVWRARDTKNGILVAIKILRHELVGEKHFLERLRVEAENTKKIIHPNLAQVLNYGETNGYGWIVMELVDGVPLSKLLENNQTITPRKLLPILIQVANALNAVHSAGVIHRDIKPANILVNKENVVKITDFGISKSNTQPNMTAVGMVMGTAQYLAPEQTVGESASHLGDIYALGIIAYEALVGKRPYTGKTQFDIAFAHVNEPVPALPSYVPPVLATLIEKMLAKNPEDRPKTAKELSMDLYNVMLQVCPDAKVPVSSFPRLDRPLTRRDTQRVPKISANKKEAMRLVEAECVSRETGEVSISNEAHEKVIKKTDLTENFDNSSKDKTFDEILTEAKNENFGDSKFKKYFVSLMIILLIIFFILVFKYAVTQVIYNSTLYNFFEINNSFINSISCKDIENIYSFQNINYFMV